MSERSTLLIVEDDPGIQRQLRWCFDDFNIVTAGDSKEAIAQLRRHEPDVVTLDMGLPPDPGGTSEGLATLEKIQQLSPYTKVIVVTGNDDRESAVQAIGMGAYDFYLKPIDPDILKLIVNRALQLRELEKENRSLSSQTQDSPLAGIIATSASMLNVCRIIERVAPTDVTTLLLGESGTGKEVLARALHNLSDRASAKFVAINCAAIPETLLESELFGYEKGAFTGAIKQTKGKIESANGGTFFLDEIGDLPMPLQAKLLRFLQERIIERVGGRQEIPVDVRVICATHQNLKDMISSGTFREDLYYRLSEISINIPPLRERDGDAVLLARSFLNKLTESLSGKAKRFSNSALIALEKYAWPGNVRELENKVKRAVIMSEGEQITPEELELDNLNSTPDLPFNLRVVRETAEKDAVIRALSYVNNNIAQAAELLGVSRPTLYDLIKKLNIEV
ncbi:MAG: PEP-CTERM-box response regulator transcription factor [Gammaproteobacteria bacterium]|nr:PEP-CTERM-box response regulator transcription factor [Gammaproteobacteria bacterium]